MKDNKSMSRSESINLDDITYQPAVLADQDEMRKAIQTMINHNGRWIENGVEYIYDGAVVKYSDYKRTKRLHYISFIIAVIALVVAIVLVATHVID